MDKIRQIKIMKEGNYICYQKYKKTRKEGHITPRIANIQIFKEMLIEESTDIIGNGEIINNIRYADDSVKLSTNLIEQSFMSGK